MVHKDDIKHRLLREVVQENAGTRLTPSPPLLRQPPHVRRPGRRRALLVTVSVILLSAASVLMTFPTESRRLASLVALGSQVLQMAWPSLAAQRAGEAEANFPAPVPIDLTAFPLSIKKIVLDPGHGGKDGGAETPQGLLEKEITLDIGHRLRLLLEQAAFEVLMTRQKDETIPLVQRTALANVSRADLFVSIHVNWFTMPETRGAETYYLGPTDDPHTLQLASLENRHSGYSLGEFRRLLDSIYLDVRRTESRRLALALQHALAQSLRIVNPDLVNRGVKKAPFLVLVATKMPAVLAEVSYLSNQEEARLLSTAEYRQHIAQALFDGIRAYADALNNRSSMKGS
jgi:N-acetylmuramoyl-L-alanine amidase